MCEEPNSIARQLCRDAGTSWAGVFSSSIHVPARLRKALQGHLAHLTSLSSRRRTRHIHRNPPHPKRKKGTIEGLNHASCAAYGLNEQVVPPAAQLLAYACSGNTSKLNQLAQQHGVNINQLCGLHCQTALHAAAERGQVESCKLLLQLGADTYQYDDKQVSALMLAAKNGHHEVVKVLLEAGADAFAVDESGTNALLLAAGCGSAECMQLLLREGCDADYHNSDLGPGEHALLVAAAGGWADCVALLLAAGARVNRTDKEGRTALWAASRAGHLAVVQVLLMQPRLKHIRHFVTGTTPIMEAQAAGHSAIVSLLAAHMTQQQQQQEVPCLTERQQQQQQQHTTVRQQQQQQEQQPGQQQEQQQRQHSSRDIIEQQQLCQQQSVLLQSNSGDGLHKQAAVAAATTAVRGLQKGLQAPSMALAY